MSGGSFHYLCHKEEEQLFSSMVAEEIENMADALAEEGFSDAATATLRVLLEIRKAKNRVETRAADLRGVWRAMEWYRSADWSREQLEEAIQAWSGELEEAVPSGSLSRQ